MGLHSRRRKRRPRRLRCQPLEPRVVLSHTLLITEFMAANDRTLDDEDGDDSDWVEIYNPTDAAVDLDGWYLTDNASDREKWAFPAVTLDAGGFLVVFASDKDRASAAGELHTNFKLDADGEYVGLVGPDLSIASEFMPGGSGFPRQLTDVSYGLPMEVAGDNVLQAAGAAARVHVPTSGAVDTTWMQPGFNDAAWTAGDAAIGYETSPADYAGHFSTAVPVGTTSVYVRVPFSVDALSAVGTLALAMKYDDGFVAYLNGVHIAAANAPATPQWNSTATTQNSDSAAVVFEEFDLTSFRGELVAGENLLAIHSLNISRSSSDLLMVPQLIASEIVLEEGAAAGFFARPTPGAANSAEVVHGFVEDVSIDVGRGFYEEPFQVTISGPGGGAEIRYTIDGSAPTAETGAVYAGPLTIDRTTVLRAAAFLPDFEPSPVATQTYIFVDDVARQSYQSTIAAGFPTTWGGTSPDYGMDPDVIGPNDRFGGVYAATIRDDLQAIPTLSISADVDDLFGPNGIYTNSSQRGSAWERAASFEMVDPNDQEEFQADVGLRMHGGAFRSHGLSKKHSMRVLFKSEYGPPTLEFPFFGPDAAQRFNTLVLRMESNDGYAWDGAGSQPQYARDEFGRRTQLAMEQPSPHGRYLHVYINGIYWGMYNVTERADAAFAESYYGGEREEWDAVNSGDPLDGDLEAWNTLLSLSRDVANASTNAQRTAAFMRLQGLNPDGSDNPAWESYLDVDNYIDYLIVNYYGGNGDWPFKNYYFARHRGAESQGFVFHMWDAEWTLNLRSDVNTNRISDSRGVAEPFSLIRASEEFRLRFADRVQKHFFNGGALYVNPDDPTRDPEQPENNVPAARYVAVTEEARLGLVAESARWGDMHRSVPLTPNAEWEAERNRLLQNYFPFRSANMISQFRAAGLFPSVGAPVFSQRGGEVESGFSLSLAAANGAPDIYYTLDGSDPRLVGGGIRPTAIRYSGPITLTEDVRIRTRSLQGGTWSALDEAAFQVETTMPLLSGDFDGSGVVDQVDLDLVLVHWGQDGTVPPDQWVGDLPSGTIDQDELDRVLAGWGNAAAVAEVASPLQAEVSEARSRANSTEGRVAELGPTDADQDKRSSKVPTAALDAAFTSRGEVFKRL